MPIQLEFKYRPTEHSDLGYKINWQTFIYIAVTGHKHFFSGFKLVLQPEVMWKKLLFPWWDCSLYWNKVLLDDLEADFYLPSTLPRLSHVPFTTNKCKKGLVICDLPGFNNLPRGQWARQCDVALSFKGWERLSPRVGKKSGNPPNPEKNLFFNEPSAKSYQQEKGKQNGTKKTKSKRVVEKVYSIIIYTVVYYLVYSIIARRHNMTEFVYIIHWP